MTEIIIPNPEVEVGGFDVIANRKVTHEFIMVRPTTIALIPREKVRKPAGGFVWVEQTPRAPQIFTMIEPSNNPMPLITLDGIERRVEFEMLGEWDAIMARHDVFTHQGKDWEVAELFYDNGYEARAMVVGRG